MLEKIMDRIGSGGGGRTYAIEASPVRNKTQQKRDAWAYVGNWRRRAVDRLARLAGQPRRVSLQERFTVYLYLSISLSGLNPDRLSSSGFYQEVGDGECRKENEFADLVYGRGAECLPDRRGDQHEAEHRSPDAQWRTHG